MCLNCLTGRRNAIPRSSAVCCFRFELRTFTESLESLGERTVAATRREGEGRGPREVPRRDGRAESPTQNFSDIAKRRMCASTHCKVPIREQSASKQGGKNVNGY